MQSDLQHAVESIHSAPLQAVFVASGGGSQALAWLVGVAGATNTVLEVTLPYSYSSFDRFIGYQPEHYVSKETAIVMARVAYRRARVLAPEGVPSVGVACTAALVTTRPKRGEHRCHVAIRDERETSVYSLVLQKDARGRSGEEIVVSRLIINTLLTACDCGPQLDLGLMEGESVTAERIAQPDPVLAVLRGELHAITIDLNQQVSTKLPHDVTVLPGAFNPLHGGHLQLAHIAGQVTGRPVHFELSVENVDKPQLAEADVRQRLEQFYGRGTITITTAPLFDQKAELFPGSVFVLGFDTATRLVNPRYYGNDPQAMVAALTKIRDLGCSFLVAGRLHEGVFRTLDDVPVPDAFKEMFAAVPDDMFRTDMSSTELRQQFMDTFSGL